MIGLPIIMSVGSCYFTSVNKMDRRDIRILFRYRSNAISTMGDSIKNKVLACRSTQFKVFINTWRECIKVKEGLNKLMNDIKKEYDTVLIYRLHDYDDKVLRAKLFVGKVESVHLKIKFLAATV